MTDTVLPVEADLDHADSLGLLHRQTGILELIGDGAPLPEVLTAVATALEELIPGCRCSILLLDPLAGTLHHGAAPSLPTDYSAAIDGLPIGPYAGSCGSAAYRDESVVVGDIATDPLWDDYRELAIPYGLRACWSSPIRGRHGSSAPSRCTTAIPTGPTPASGAWWSASRTSRPSRSTTRGSTAR